jgi:outer membrane protein
MKRAIAVSLGVLLSSSTAWSADLLAVYERALTSDPQIREADALRRATRESRPQALAALLPQVTGSASRQKDDTSGTSTSVFVLNGVLVPSDRSGNGNQTNTRWSVDLRQSVFSWIDWVALRRADHQVAQAEADYQAAQQNLISRVGDAYFNVLAAQDTVEAQQSAFDAISRQLEQADKRFEVGLIAITDVQEAKAARDSAAAALIAAKRSLASTQELLREITGEDYPNLTKAGESIPLRSPDPIDENQWVARSMEQNLALISSRLAADIARDNVRSAFGGHLPEVSLTASRSNAQIDSEQRLRTGAISTANSDTDDTAYALQLSVPLFAGGGTQSRVRQSEYQWQAARERLTRVSRQTERQARDAYLGVISEIARVNALRQALESNATALKATEAGYEVGTRTAVDVLDARRNLVQAQTNYSRSRYDYMLNVMKLRLASGTLDKATLTEINGWLTATPPAAAPAGTPVATPPTP